MGLLNQMAITSNLSDIKFGMEHELDGKWIKAAIHDKKSILPYLAPFIFMTYTENNIRHTLIMSCSGKIFLKSQTI